MKATTIALAGLILGGCVPFPQQNSNAYRTGYYSPQPHYPNQRAYDLNMPDGWIGEDGVYRQQSQQPQVSPFNRYMRSMGVAQ